jgi:hypothetical protein
MIQLTLTCTRIAQQNFITARGGRGIIHSGQLEINELILYELYTQLKI